MFKKATSTLAALALFIPFITSAQTSCPVLSLGSSGASVRALQIFLRNEYSSFPTTTGYFGALTEAAVKQWQKEHGIVSSGSAATTGWGVVGKKTTAAMKLCVPSTTIAPAPAPTPTQTPAPSPSPGATQCPTTQAVTCGTSHVLVLGVTDSHGCKLQDQCIAIPQSGVGGGGAFTQAGNALTTSADIVRMKSNGPGLYFEEADQKQYREDYGFWRIIADQNALFIENWESARPGESEYAQQDEFLSFHRSPTSNPGIGNHVIQWQYDFLGSGVRDLRIGANWQGSVPPQVPRTLSLTALNLSTNTLVPAIQIIPNGSSPIVSVPSGPLKVNTLCVGETCVNETQLKSLLKLIGQ